MYYGNKGQGRRRIWIAILNTVIRVDLTGKATFNQRLDGYMKVSYANKQSKTVRENRQAAASLACFRNSTAVAESEVRTIIDETCIYMTPQNLLL